MNRKIMKHLLWKDARTLGPLAVAIPVLVLLFFGALGVLDNNINLDGSSRLMGGYTIWCLLPILIAYGAPAVLVGGEEESGSLAWLRTLPAQWSSIASSKLAVAACCLGIAWVVATICFLGYWSSIPDRLLSGLGRSAMPEPFSLHLIGNVSLSVVVLLSSLITAYLCRSPITALMLVVPVAGVTITAVVFGAFALASEVPRMHSQEPVALSFQLVLLACSSLAVLTLWVVHQWAARWRLSKPLGRLAEPDAILASAEAFRPPSADAEFNWYGSAIARGRPPQWFALLWQSVRQMGWHYWTLIAIAGIGAIGLLAGRSEIGGLIVFLGVVAGYSLGPLTFYGDSVRKRCQFLADRGVSPTLVWITRITPTLGMTILLSLLAFACICINSRWRVGLAFSEFAQLTAVIFAVFAFSQLISQWSPRPVLVFFAAPVFSCFAALVLATLFEFYPSALWVLVASGAVLMIGSWRLTPQWMRGETGKSYNIPLVGYVLLALAMPYGLVLSARWATAPAHQDQWRQQLVSTALPSLSGGGLTLNLLSTSFSAQDTEPVYSHLLFQKQAELIPRLELELAETESLGAHVSIEQLKLLITFGTHEWNESLAFQNTVDRQLFESTEPLQGLQSDESLEFEDESSVAFSKEELGEIRQQERKVQALAAKVLSKWSTTVRKMAINGDASLNQLFGIAEIADARLARSLTQFLASQGPWAGDDSNATDSTSLLELIPEKQLIDQSRRVSLISDWKAYRRPAKDGFQDVRRFAGLYCMSPRQSWLAVERFRSDRFLDSAVNLILSQWESGQNFRQSEDRNRLSNFLEQAYFERDGRARSGGSLASISQRIELARANDQRFAELRRQAAILGEQK